MHFGTISDFLMQIHIYGKPADRVHDFTYLGVVYDGHLNLNSHVKQMILGRVSA